MQPDKSKPKYISSSRARTAGVRDFSGQKSANVFSQAISSTPSVQIDSQEQKRKKLFVAIGVGAVAIIVILALVALGLKRFSNAGAGDISIEKFNARIDYHDAMKCTLSESAKMQNSDYMILASDGWNEVYLRNIWIADNVTDVFYVNDTFYSVVYDGAKKDSNIVKEKSFIESKEQFSKRTGLDFPDGLKLDDDDKRKIHCDAQGATIQYDRPNVGYLTNLKTEGI